MCRLCYHRGVSRQRTTGGGIRCWHQAIDEGAVRRVALFSSAVLAAWFRTRASSNRFAVSQHRSLDET
jgi:hypothetical protein